MDEYRLDPNWKQFEGKKKYRQPDVACYTQGLRADMQVGCPENDPLSELSGTPAPPGKQAAD